MSHKLDSLPKLSRREEAALAKKLDQLLNEPSDGIPSDLINLSTVMASGGRNSKGILAFMSIASSLLTVGVIRLLVEAIT